jgi:hypothetical protein
MSADASVNPGSATSIPRAPRAALLFREATRTARQWRTYAGRAAFSGLLIGALLLVMSLGTLGATWFGDANDPSGLATVGRVLFTGFAVVEVGIATVMAPVVVARSVIEEQEDGTLDLVVLSRIPVRSILVGKVASRLLTLMTIVLGATPILSLLTTMGGVSVFEVVAVTLDALAAMVVLGALGGFFALFTRSQVIATASALAWAVPVFLFMPIAYATATFQLAAISHISPFYGTWATDGWALLSGVAFVPTVIRVARLSGRVFELKVASARYGRVFGGDTWRLRPWLYEGVALLVVSMTALPVAVALVWGSGMTLLASSSLAGMSLVQAFGTLAVWAWFVWATSWCTWLVLRLGAEWVSALDTIVRPTGGVSLRRRAEPQVGDNPVIWREVSWRALSVWGLGLLLWLLFLWLVFQSMVWLIPGGLFSIGVLNLGLAWFGTSWLATTTVETERREGTMDLLLTSTLPPWKIAVGKTLAVLLPTAPLMAIAAPLIALGLPYWSVVGLWDSLDGDVMAWEIVRGLAIAGWALVMWVFVAVISQIVALRSARPQTTYAVNAAWLGTVLLVPWMINVAFGFIAPVRWVTRWVMPLTAASGSPAVEPVLSAIVLSGLTVTGFVLMMRHYRRWHAESAP